MARRMRGLAESSRVRASKVGRLVRHRDAWPVVKDGLRNGVFPSFEHTRVRFGAQFETIVDAGASRGQFALFARWRFPDARLICFEPLPEAAAVAALVLPSDRVELHEVALGAAQGRATLHVSARDDSSSLLPIGRRQSDAFPGTAEARQVTVAVDVLQNYLTEALVKRPSLLKIDVQGLELDVLRGAGAGLRLVDEILVEASFAELYPGQPLAHEVVSYLADRGFGLVDVSRVARGERGEALQADFLFRRTRVPSASQRGEHELATIRLVAANA